MAKQCLPVLIITLACLCLSSCLSSLMTGASMLYDRHNVYQKVSDYQLSMDLNNALLIDKQLKCEGCVLDITVFNGYIVLSGHLPNRALYDLAKERIQRVQGYKHLFNAITIANLPSRNLQDAWLTARIRAQIFADANIDPKAFKVVTTDGIVYLVGEIRKEQGLLVIQIARRTQGVVRVVNSFRYFTYQ
jgi:osmotically-inducible protein OsmY